MLPVLRLKLGKYSPLFSTGVKHDFPDLRCGNPLSNPGASIVSLPAGSTAGLGGPTSMPEFLLHPI
jgi:hypothetical protein